MNEFELIDRIKTWIPRKLQGPLAIGDDAALLNPPPGEQLVFTADTIVDRVDFYSSAAKKKSPGYVSAVMTGRKALAINLSDIAAMGAKPLACVISLGIPKNFKEAWLKDFYQGLVMLAKEYHVLCSGGDITRARDFFVSIAMIGSVKKSEGVTRSGAKPGDWIAVTGALGGSLLNKHYAFQPRVREARFLVENFKPTSMMDISDGLLQDLGHLLKASRAAAELEMFEVPISQAAVTLSKGQPLKAFERACTDGEDFELLFTAPLRVKTKLEKTWRKRFPKTPLSWIGRIVKGNGEVAWIQDGKKIAAPQFKMKGYQHF